MWKDPREKLRNLLSLCKTERIEQNSFIDYVKVSHIYIIIRHTREPRQAKSKAHNNYFRFHQINLDLEMHKINTVSKMHDYIYSSLALRVYCSIA